MDTTGTGDTEQDLLSVKGINTYYGDSHILYDLSISVREGEVVSILGRNGVGKTTTLRSIMGLTPPRSGTIQFRGTDITQQAPHDTLMDGIALVPEERVIFPNLSVKENLQVPKVSNSTSDRGVSIKDVYEMFPRLEERKKQTGHSLSGGEQQMLAIARSLMTNPDLLMLDEPSEGLAPQIVADVHDIIAKLADSGLTILLVEQNVNMADSLADRHYILEKGSVQFEGQLSDLDTERQNKLLGIE
ncbi:ABC transporter ATP-binding protein [Natronomonas gomsonensis]|nr:ABC transporter ATP-binding protein [Natronomonas gomsonensis]MCY4729932.1 ABC transporter ATP-binding protein [Natronomonas gomsonensis]